MRIELVIVLIASLVGALDDVHAQAPKTVYRLGVLTELNAQDALNLWQDALREQGYVEGENVAFESLGAAEKVDLLPGLASELVQRKVDIILTGSTPPAVAAKHVTTTIPIVTMSADPVGAGLITSLARPRGNVTGIYVPVIDMAAKRLQLLKETIPNLTSAAIVLNPNNPTALLQAKATEEAAHSLGIHTFAVEITSQSDLPKAFQILLTKRPHGFVVMQDPVMYKAAEELAKFALKNRFPAFHPFRRFADAGGLMSYGVSVTGLYTTAATYVDKILKGAKPADLPMEQPSRYEFVINLKTARALGVSIPDSILLRADEVIR